MPEVISWTGTPGVPKHTIWPYWKISGSPYEWHKNQKKKDHEYGRCAKYFGGWKKTWAASMRGYVKHSICISFWPRSSREPVSGECVIHKPSSGRHVMQTAETRDFHQDECQPTVRGHNKDVCQWRSGGPVGTGLQDEDKGRLVCSHPCKDTSRGKRQGKWRSWQKGSPCLGTKLDWNQYAHCYRYGHWKDKYPYWTNPPSNKRTEIRSPRAYTS